MDDIFSKRMPPIIGGAAVMEDSVIRLLGQMALLE